MIGNEVLLTIAEFALALAGFSAVVLVLAQRGGEIDEVASYLVRFMILNSVTAGFMALLPFLVAALGASGSAIWRISSGTYVAGLFPMLPLATRQARDVSSRIQSPYHKTFWSVSLVAHVVQLANLVGYPYPPSYGGFLLGIDLLLALAGAQFVVVVFRLLR